MKRLFRLLVLVLLIALAAAFATAAGPATTLQLHNGEAATIQCVDPASNLSLDFQDDQVLELHCFRYYPAPGEKYQTWLPAIFFHEDK